MKIVENIQTRLELHGIEESPLQACHVHHEHVDTNLEVYTNYRVIKSKSNAFIVDSKHQLRILKTEKYIKYTN